MAENQMKTFADSVLDARKGMADELAGQAEHIQKLTRELAELQLRHERTERATSHHWDTLASAAAATTAEYESRVTPEAALEGVLGAVRGLMTATLPEQVFATLTEEAAQLGVRAAAFDVRGKAAWGASSHGFGPALTDKVLRSLIVPLNQDNPFRQVCETAGDVEASTDTLRKNRNVIDRFKPAAHAPILLLPVRSAGTVTAIFYADPGDSGKPLPVSALKILAEFAGAQIDRLIALGGGFTDEEASVEPDEVVEVVESASAAQGAPVEISASENALTEAPREEHAADEAHLNVAAAEVSPVSEQASAAPVAESPAEIAPIEFAPPATETEMPADDQEVVAESPAPPAEVVTKAEEPEPAASVESTHPSEVAQLEFPAPHEPLPIDASPEASDHPADPAPVAVEPLDEHLEPATLESAVAAPVSSEPIAVSASETEGAPTPVVPSEFDVMQLTEADQKTHKDAKRFAKLLVSEIELYNKAKVADGRRNQDLYRRLKTDIDRSRLTFEKRFGKSLSKQVDYFNDEMVKILAANDPAVLGPEYPGPAA